MKAAVFANMKFMGKENADINLMRKPEIVV
jgi:hypothetical protein